MAKTLLESSNPSEEAIPHERKSSDLVSNGPSPQNKQTNTNKEKATSFDKKGGGVVNGKEAEIPEDTRTLQQESSNTDGLPLPDTDTEMQVPPPSHDCTNPQKPQVKNGREPRSAPLVKLSVDLIKTYKHINEVYYAAKRRKQAQAAATAAGSANSTVAGSSTSTSGKPINDGHDDENYDYKIQANEKLHDRYIVKQRIGRGSFGQVIRAHDLRTRKDVAIKIIKSRKPFFRQAKTEIELLQKLNQSDPEDQWFVVRLLDTFVHHRHQCLVFEMLSHNLYDLLRNTKYQGVSLNLIKKFARQILKALYHLSRKEIDVIHCDLKPENILLRNPKRSAIKVIDFGSSCRSDNKLYTYIQSRFYRSPEVILGLPYSAAIDMWSLGCILVEMHTGEPLFSGSNEHDQMIRLVAVLGMPPRHMLLQGTKTSKFFDRISDENGNETFQIKPRKHATSKAAINAYARSLEDIIGANSGGPQGRRKGEPGHSVAIYATFVDLIRKMLDYDPSVRIKPTDALRHAYFRDFVAGSNSNGVSQQQQQMNSDEQNQPSSTTGKQMMAAVTGKGSIVMNEHSTDALGTVRSGRFPWPVAGNAAGIQTVPPQYRQGRAKRPGSAPAKTH